MSIFIAELFGTLILVLLGNGSVANVLLSRSKGENGGWIVITAGWGFAVALGVYAVGTISGAHLNPAVTLGFALIQKTPWNQVSFYIAGQMVGAMFGAFLVWVCYYSHWAYSDPKLKLLCFCTRPAIRKSFWNFITEAVATAVLLFGILSILAAPNMTFEMSPYLIGILIFAIGLSLGGPTGFAINPARDLGPRLMHWWLPIAKKTDSDWGYAWIPIIGPLVGGAIGALLYQRFFS